MKFLSRTLPGIVLATALATACSTDFPTEAAPADLVTAKGGPGNATHTSTDIGAFLGGYASRVNGVNDVGDVVGRVFSGPASGAFAIVGGSSMQLPGNATEARAISNGSPLYIVGYVGIPTQPLRWTITGGTASGPTNLDVGGASYGGAVAVNDGGVAVGYAAEVAAIWGADGSLTLISSPQGFAVGRGRDINNTGQAVFTFSGSSGENARAYVRLASGALFELPPLTGDASSNVTGISDAESNTVYIAGNSTSAPGSGRAVRWTVDVATGGITQTLVRPENSVALGISNDGGVAGSLQESKPGAILWRGSELLKLKPPKGLRNGIGWAISPNGEFVAGEAYSPRVGSNAVLWTILSP